MDTPQLVTLDGDENSQMALSLMALQVAATGPSRGAVAARAALDAYEGARRDGASVQDAATKASRTLKLEMETP